MNSKLKTKNCFSAGSALILTVVLTTLLAIVGVAFVLVARVDKTATSAIAENKQLNLAVDSVVATICQQLAEDVPGMQPAQEYYDYPGYTRAPGVDGTLFTPDDVVSGDAWLASLEPRIDDNGTPGDLTDDVYYWPQISDIYEAVPGWRVGLLEWYGVQDTWRESAPYGDKFLPHLLRARIIAEANSVSGAFDTNPASTYLPIDFGGPADADGDGVADSRWVAVPNMTSKGRDIYTAVRIVDNGGMLNVNTAYKFDPNNPGPNGEYVDGSSQMQINLMALAERGTTYLPQEESNRLLGFRGGSAVEPNDIKAYEYNVVCRYDRPADPYTPFDISDELELKNRFFIKNLRTSTRLKECWTDAYKVGVYTPFDVNIPNWFVRVFPVDPNIYSYRHISTTYNMDRIIDPNGLKMFNINGIDPVTGPDVDGLYKAIKDGILAANVPVDPCAVAAQAAVNIKDYVDNEQPDQITAYTAGGTTYYGFERPCIYISELAYSIVENPREPDKYYRSYAIELHKPYFEDDLPAGGQWVLAIDDNQKYSVSWSGISRFHILLAEDANAPLGPLIDFNDITPTQGPRPQNGARAAELVGTDFFWPAIPEANSYDMYLGTDFNFVANANGDSGTGIGPEFIIRHIGTNMLGSLGLDPNTDYYWRVDAIDDANNVIAGDVWSFSTSEPVPQYFSGFFGPGSRIQLSRLVAQTGGYITVDWMVVPPFDPNVPEVVSFQRDIAPLRVIKRLWSDLSPPMPPPTLGYNNFFTRNDVAGIQYFPANRAFRNVGQIGKVFRVYAYDDFNEFTNEEQVKTDLSLPVFQQVFKYLTRFDPTADGVDNDGDGLGQGTTDGKELKVAGRININTAPWYVIAQLPWVSRVLPGPPPTPNYDLARAIADYRDINGPFTSTGELNRVVDPNVYRSIDYYARPDGLADGDQLTFPDLSAGDGVADDFEERDLIFARISDLVTVRSDVFTAYILVRIGTDGPQKRVIAILDRSDVYPRPAGGRVKIRALYQVPDPR